MQFGAGAGLAVGDCASGPGGGRRARMNADSARPTQHAFASALLDIGAAGPLAGMAVAIPVLVVGMLESPIAPSPPRGTLGPAGALGIPEVVGGYLQEGHSLFYDLMLLLVRGGIPE